MNRKQRKERLKRFKLAKKLAKKMRRQTEALRRLRLPLGGLPPGTYRGTAYVQDGFFGLLFAQGAQGSRFAPMLHIPTTTDK